MKLELYRVRKTDEATIGELFVDNRFQCYTLEDTVRAGPKIEGITAIPLGDYEVQITPSVRFKRDMPLVMNVPGFSGIRIHPGNTAADTAGCILVGTMAGYDVLLNSQAAFTKLFDVLQNAWSNGEAIKLFIIDGRRI